MSVTKFGYVLVLLALTLEFQMVSCESDTTRDMDRSKEYLRHQQNRQQRSFGVDRRTERNSHEEDTSSSMKSHVVGRGTETRLPIGSKKRVTVELSSSEIGHSEKEKESETSIEKPTTQIRHGRSRTHFARQIKLEDFESSRIRTKRVRLSSNVTDASIATTFEEKDEQNEEEEKEEKEEKDEDEEEEEGGKSRYLPRKYELVEDGKVDFGEATTTITKKDRWAYGTTETWTESTRQLNELIRKVFRQQAGIVRTAYREKQDSSQVNKSRKVSGGTLRGKHRSENDLSESMANATVAYGRIVHSSSTIKEVGSRRETNGNVFGEVPLLEDYGTVGDPKVVGNGSGSKIDDYEDYGTSVTVDDENENEDEDVEENVAEDEDDLERPLTKRPIEKEPVQVDIVTRFLRIIENQHLLGENCTAGTDLNLGEGVVDRYAQERFRLEANLAVNRANMLTRLWKYAPEVMLSSEYLLHASVLSMVEFDEDIFAAGNCYDKLQYKDRWLYCPFAHRLQDQDGVLVKDLAIEYKYLSNSSEWFYIARKNAERVIASNNQFSQGFHTYTHNESAHTEREDDEILTVRYEDGRWSKPYYDCGGGNIWMLTYTVPFFGYVNDTYFFNHDEKGLLRLAG